jgi:PBP1b-binding outer membrane lipoprotein LpoB
MKQLYFLILFALIFSSCKKENIEPENTAPLQITFTGSNSNPELCKVYVVKSRTIDSMYTDSSSVINSTKTFKAKFGQTVTIYYVTQNNTGYYNLSVKFNGKEQMHDGFTSGRVSFITSNN